MALGNARNLTDSAHGRKNRCAQNDITAAIPKIVQGHIATRPNRTVLSALADAVFDDCDFDAEFFESAVITQMRFAEKGHGDCTDFAPDPT